jgi:hypothetical protein
MSGHPMHSGLDWGGDAVDTSELRSYLDQIAERHHGTKADLREIVYQKAFAEHEKYLETGRREHITRAALLASYGFSRLSEEEPPSPACLINLTGYLYSVHYETSHRTLTLHSW